MTEERGFLPYIDAAAKDDPGRHYASFGDVCISVGDVHRQSSAVAAHLRGLTGRQVDLVVDGGVLRVDWRDDGVWLSGPVAFVFEGVLSPVLMGAAP